jgi:hypothetical protein
MIWNKFQENILKKWSAMAKTYSTMHSISAQYYSKLDKYLVIPVILLGAAASSSIFTTSSDSIDKSNAIWSYINGGMVLLMTGISSISKFIDTNEKQAKHTSASFKYTNIAMNIDTLLSFPRADRVEDPRLFINETKTSILEVREHAPNIHTWVIDSYIKKIDKSLTNTHTKINRNQGSTVYTTEKEINIEDLCLTSQSEQLSEKDIMVSIDKTNTTHQQLPDKDHILLRIDNKTNTAKKIKNHEIVYNTLLSPSDDKIRDITKKLKHYDTQSESDSDNN